MSALEEIQRTSIKTGLLNSGINIFQKFFESHCEIRNIFFVHDGEVVEGKGMEKKIGLAWGVGVAQRHCLTSSLNL